MSKTKGSHEKVEGEFLSTDIYISTTGQDTNVRDTNVSAKISETLGEGEYQSNTSDTEHVEPKQGCFSRLIGLIFDCFISAMLIVGEITCLSYLYPDSFTQIKSCCYDLYELLCPLMNNILTALKY